MSASAIDSMAGSKPEEMPDTGTHGADAGTEPPQGQPGAAGPSNSASAPSDLLAGAIAHAGKGTVPAESIFSTGNRIESVDLEGPAIFARHADMIRSANKEVLIQTFVWVPESAAAHTILDALSDLAASHSADVRYPN